MMMNSVVPMPKAPAVSARTGGGMRSSDAGTSHANSRSAAKPLECPQSKHLGREFNMARFDTNRSAEMEVFVRVVDLGGFTQAARKLRLTPSGVSKLISRLEARLGTRLINRTTRKLTLTEEGQAFYQRAVRILAE